jgi:hypothetical protein
MTLSIRHLTSPGVVAGLPYIGIKTTTLNPFTQRLQHLFFPSDFTHPSSPLNHEGFQHIRVSPSADSLPVPCSLIPIIIPALRVKSTKSVRRLFDFSQFPMSLTPLHLNPVKNHDLIVTLGGWSHFSHLHCRLVIVSARCCHHALIYLAQG